MLKKNKIIFRNQLNDSECGITCLFMIFNFYGLKVSLETLRTLSLNYTNGISINLLKKITELYNFDSKVFKSDIDSLKMITVPLIIYWDCNHFVILRKIRNNKFYIHNPALGKQILSYSEFSNHFSGIALWCYPKFEIKKAYKKYQKSLLKTINDNKYIILFIAVLGISLQIINIYIYKFIENVSTSINIDRGYNSYSIWLYLLIIFLFVFLGNLIFRSLIIRTLKKVDIYLYELLIDKIVNLPIMNHYFKLKGDILYRITLIENLSSLSLTTIINLIINMIAIVILSIFMFMQSVQMSIMLTVIGLIIMIISIYAMKILDVHVNNWLLNSVNNQSKITELVNNIQLIKSMNLQSDFKKNINNHVEIKINSRTKYDNYKNVFESFLSTISITVPIIIIIYGSILIKENSLDIEQLIAFIFISGIFIQPFTEIAKETTNLNYMNSMVSMISDMIDWQEDKETSQKYTKNLLSGNIKVVNLNFKYSVLQPNILSNLSFEVDNNDFLLIKGESGAGKSTLLKLLGKIYRSDNTPIQIDNININSYKDQNFFEGVIYVDQFSKLFNKTIKENLTIGCDDIEEKDIYNILKKVNIFDEIMSMDNQILTKVNEEGNNLSGGQQQRLVLARALLRKPKILLLDEPTSNLDGISEQKIFEYLKNLECTVIIITHSEQIFEYINKVYYIQSNIVEKQNNL